jgi:hypothetical protein
MCFYGGFADGQLGGDLGVGLTAGQDPQYDDLPLGERLQRVRCYRWRAGGQPGEAVQ